MLAAEDAGLLSIADEPVGLFLCSVNRATPGAA